MQQPAEQPGAASTSDEQERALAMIAEAIEHLEGLGLADERGRVVVEPASAFHWL